MPKTKKKTTRDAVRAEASPPSQPRITIVGIGASAGGIEALQAFFDALPADTGLAYVVVLHLSPEYPSDIASILAHATSMSVVEVHAGREYALAPNRLYVVAPATQIEVGDKDIRGKAFVEPRGRRTVIDMALRSLAAHGDGFAVILSGGGSDGTLGARAVKEAGGVVLVQDPREAQHDGMPRAAIAAAVADIVLPVRDLAHRLAEIASNKDHVRALLQAPEADAAAHADADERVLKRMFELLRARTGHDFSQYKRATILRRLARRMQLRHRANLEEYLAYLRENPEEAQALFDDFLISVTTFFRDPESWEALRKHVVVPLVDATDSNEPIRVWVPGCATGEEAYTIAILFKEEIGRRDTHREVVIFGSDVDQAALITAREGLYPQAIAADVSEARLARFFRAEGDHYRITSEIRDCVVFAAHSVLRDPPFSKLHLISCRNLLIYLNRDLQQQLQGVFRYGLRDDGYLFIGVSETADPDLFEPIDKQHRLFRARSRATGSPMRLPQLPAVPLSPPLVERVRERGVRMRRSPADLHVEALEKSGPPTALVDDHWNIVHLSTSAGRFLQPRGGTPSQTLTDLVRPELVDELRSGLHYVFEAGEPYLSPFVPVRFNGASRLVAVLVQSHLRKEEQGAYALVAFLEAGSAGTLAAPERPESTDAVVQGLRDKLRIAEQRLESMRQEHSLAFEDLRAANEELQSLNEEYRSTTEELETSKEELQSVNEELQTVNHELKMKLEEVSRANNDLENFMAATDIPMLFLDRSLCIKRYTAPLRQVFNVMAHDAGRPIGDLTHNLVYQDLERDAAQVLAALTPIERAVKTRSGESLVVRLRPYRTAEDKIDGVVVTFVK